VYTTAQKNVPVNYIIITPAVHADDIDRVLRATTACLSVYAPIGKRLELSATAVLLRCVASRTVMG